MEGGENSKTENFNWEVILRNYENIIASGTKSMKIKAMFMLAKYSKKAPEHVLSTTIPILIEILSCNNVANDSAPSLLQEAAAYCLKCIACRGDGRLAIEMGEHGVARCLIRLLPRAEGKMQKVLIECLLVVVSFCDASRKFVAANGGLEIIISLLSSCSNDVRLYLLEILSALALRMEVRKELIRLRALRFIVEAAGVGSMISRERACQSIGLLGLSGEGKRILFELGVIPVLVELFRVVDNSTKLVAGNTLGVLLNHVDYLRPIAQAGAIPLYAELLQGHDVSGKEIAEDVFCILAIAEENTVEIVGQLVKLLREGDDEAKAAAIDVIWDLLLYKHATSVIRDSGAAYILVELLSHGTEEIKKKISGAFSQMSYQESGRMVLGDAGAIPVLIDLLHDETGELRDNVVEALSNFNEDPLYHDTVSVVVNAPSFRILQNRLTPLGAMTAHITRSLRTMSIE